MKTKEIYLQLGKYQIRLDKLFKGWVAESPMEESTIIRQYVDFKANNSFEYSKEDWFTDVLMEDWFTKEDIVLYCLQLLEIALKKKYVKDCVLDIPKLISIKDNEDELHAFLLDFCNKITFLNN